MHDVILGVGVGVGVAAGCLVVAGVAANSVYRLWVWFGPDRAEGLFTNDPVWSGHCAESVLWRARVSPEQALDIAHTAVDLVGSYPAERWDPWTIVGWSNNWGPWPRFQLAVVLKTTPGGVVEFLSCSRPRWCRTRFDFGVSYKRAMRLSGTIQGLADASRATSSLPALSPAPA